MKAKVVSRILSIIAAIALIIITAQQFDAAQQHDSLRYWLFDVGQGDAMMLETPNGEQIVIDGGPDSSIIRELSRVMPLNDKEIDLVILTHNHADHITGVNEILLRYSVKRVWINGAVHTTDAYRQFLEIMKAKNITPEIVSSGDAVKFGELSGLVLWPPKQETGRLPDNQNWESVVTYWQYGNNTILLTGDMEKEQEVTMLQQGLLKPTSLLKVPHQGSRTSSVEEMLVITSPKQAVLSVGKNSYGHPHPDVIDRYRKLNIPILRTDQSGTIICDFSLVSFSCAGSR